METERFAHDVEAVLGHLQRVVAISQAQLPVGLVGTVAAVLVVG